MYKTLVMVLFISWAPAPASGGDPPTGEPPVALKSRELPHRHNECHLCHTKKARLFGKSAGTTDLEHPGISPAHGKREISCHSCHDINNHNYLIKSRSLPATFEDSSPVCANCHRERFRDWKRGLHGKRSGGWALPKTQYQCIDCHAPHHVSFEKMETRDNQPVPHNVIRKGHP
jgi:hypothetical protein